MLGPVILITTMGTCSRTSFLYTTVYVCIQDNLIGAEEFDAV